MAHGFLQATDLRTERNYLGNIAGAIGSRIRKSSDLARRERAYAKRQAENSTDNADFNGPPRGFFFTRALGSSFGGDRIARTRGRFETDPPAGRDPTGNQASRFRGGFDYTDNSGGIAEGLSDSGISPSNILGGGGGVASKLLEAGPSAINPEVLGGEIAKYQGSPTTNAAGFTVDTQATEIKDIVGILNQIGQMIVRTNNNTIQAVDNVQRVNVKVVESVQSLGQLQVSIAERQIQNQRLLASNAENTAEKIAARQQASVEKANMAGQRASSGDLDPIKGTGPNLGGGILGNMFGTLGNVLDTGMSLLGGRRARGRARARQGFSTANRGDVGIRGMNFRNNSMTGGTLSSNRVLAGNYSPNGLGKAQNDITRRYARRFGESAAIKRFGVEGLEAAGMGLGKKAAMAKFLKPVLKRVPLVGGLLDFGISVALGEEVGRAAARAVGATLGATLGSFLFPGAGTILGGVAGDILAGSVYTALKGGSRESSTDMSLTPFATGGIITKPTAALMGENSKPEGVFPLGGAEGKKTFRLFGEGVVEAQKRDKKSYAELQAAGLAQYYENQNGWDTFIQRFGEFFPKFEIKLPWMNDEDNENPTVRNLYSPTLGGGNMDPSKLAGDSAYAKAWLATINATEANNPDRYNTLVGGEVVPELTKMTIQEVYDMAYGSSIGQGFLPERFGGRKVKYGADSHAAGGYQFHPDTMLANARRMGLDPSKALFDPNNQQLLALQHLAGLGVDPNAAMTAEGLSKAGSIAGWEGLSVPKGKITKDQAMALYNKFLTEVQATTAVEGAAKDPAKMRALIETLGGDPDAEVISPEITSPRNNNNGLLEAASDIFFRSLQLPNIFKVPEVLQPQSQSTGNNEDALALGLATGGSANMGLNPFSILSHTALS